MPPHPTHTLDLNFLGLPEAIAVYLIPHRQGALLVECGPGSTLPALQQALQQLGYRPGDVTDVLLTHIHLDHAGAAGWWARQGARIHVHPVGAPHLLNPEKLLSSAQRIYGEAMERLWGEFLPTPQESLNILQDGVEVEIGGVRLLPLDTPGHAEHHFVYIFEEMCFSGDIGGVRLAGEKHLRLPMPPPEFHPGKWRASVQRLRAAGFRRIAPTHFGVFDDAAEHLQAIERALDEVEAWMEATLPADPPAGALNQAFLDWARRRSLGEGVSEETLQRYEAANPSWMSTYGIQRYWKKNR
jgi:glyoxylase-like metal-dependent hydrolase (beta-lactamase superfamily II)